VLPPDSGAAVGSGDGFGAGVASLHWAPAMGRPQDMLASAHGSRVAVWGLHGDTGSPATELLGCLEHDAAVVKVEFNMLGTCLAAATQARGVHVWRADLVGRWLRLCVATGVDEPPPGAAEAGTAMLTDGGSEGGAVPLSLGFGTGAAAVEVD
jgi:hypothetical protein